MAKYLVIVESPAKCKTISKFLGNEYILEASYGHVRDLPGKSLGVDIKKGFTPSYQSLKDKSKILKQLSKIAKQCDTIYLATDPDREGEAIAWHIMEAIKLPTKKTKRIVFNEITEKAIKQAIQSSRTVDMDLVNAQQARRILDRLIGYKVSPILSRKIQKGLSAGRVQSVAVKIICDREKDILAFIPREFWVIQCSLNGTPDSGFFLSTLVAKTTLKQKYEPTNEEEASLVKKQLQASSFSVDDIIKSRIKRKPAPPFITSTLQQEASRKLNWPAKKTMIVAQKLYEGIDINGEPTGLITYMRTDSIRLSESAIAEAKAFITATYSDKYLGQPVKTPTKKSKIQDAHEAVRPVNIDLPPERIKSQLTEDLYKLYSLIWKRFIASQMAVAEYDRTQFVIKAKGEETYFLRSSGSILVFDGFTKIYTEGKDDTKEETSSSVTLPDLTKGQSLNLNEVTTEQKFTQPPPRYSEATLVKVLEELGIGRPSTYAPTLSTIQDRGYILKEQKKLLPTELGMVTNKQLESFFMNILDLKFTAAMENQLDNIQDGKNEWHTVVSDYYSPLESMIETANKEMKKVSVGERNLGVDPKSGKEVIVKIGRFGPMVQLGQASEDEKPQFASIGPDMDIKTITCEQALLLLDYPKTLGSYKTMDIILNRGKYGPYVKYGSQFCSIPQEISMHTISLDEAIQLIEEKEKQDSQKVIQSFEDQDPIIQILNGKYGPYIKHGKKNVKIPKDTDPKAITLDDCLELIKSYKPKKRRK